MEKLQICRVCLIDDVHYLIENTQQQIVFEKLTSIQLQTNDSKPRTVCYICYAKLQTIRRFMLQCLKAEKVLTEMLNSDNETDLQAKLNRLIPKSYPLRITSTEQNNIESDVDDDVITQDIKHETDDEMQDIYEIEPVATETDLISQIEKSTAVASEHKAGNEKYVVPITYVDSNTDEDHDTDIEYVDTITLNDDSNNPNIIKQKGIINKTQTNTTPSEIEDKKANCDTGQLKDQQFFCNYCQLQFTCVSSFIQHSRLTHTDRRSAKKPYFVCPMCPKKFFDYYYFNAHIKSHRDGRPRCELCQKSFSYKYSLYKHIKKFHTNVNGEEIHTCDVCHKNYSSENDLMHHLNLHRTGIQCDVCGKVFKKKAYLKAHYRGVHTGEKPYSCNICQNRFTYKSCLRTHIKSHDRISGDI